MGKDSPNKEQELAIKHGEGPMLVVAGAGTGKTKVIIERLARLVESGVAKDKILCLTFTEKAAQEMLDRAAERLQNSYGVELNIYTFNAFGAEMLREFAVEIGLSSNLQLLGSNGKIVFLRQHLDELGFDYFAPTSRPDGQLADISDYFSHLKQQLVKPADYLDFAGKLPASDEAERLDKKRHQELAHAYGIYQKLARSRNIIDYDDQLYILVELLEKRPNVLRRLQERFKFVMVDEFQDTNPMQSRLIDLLVGDSGNIFAVGDDDQSIYGWRGATLANILEFTKRYPKTKEVTLIENFRSTQEILDNAWTLIQNNNPSRLESINNLDKKLRAFRGRGEKPAVHKFSRLDAELNWVAEDIKARLAAGTPPGQIAVLARSKAGVSRVHQMLDSVGIEHTVSGITNDLYQNPAVNTMIEAFKTIINPDDNQALYHTLGGQLFSVSPEQLSQSSQKARHEHRSLWDVLSEQNDSELKTALQLIANWRNNSPAVNIRSLAYDILIDSGLKDRILNAVEQDSNAAASARALGTWFSTLLDFEQVAIIPSASTYLDSLEALRAEGQAISDDADNILATLPAVMTVHKAKGLEWEVVYIVDCTEFSFPLKNQGKSLEVPKALAKTSAADDHYAEERRLMYVACTRARDQLILTHSESHNGVTTRKPSRFIKEFFGFEDGDAQAADKQVGLDLLVSSKPSGKFLPLPASMLQGENLVLTASQADDYLTCPLNFYYKHVLYMPEEPGFATAVGSLFHGLIQELNDAKLHGKPTPSLKPMLEKLQADWPKVGYSSKAQAERAKKAGLEAFEKTYHRINGEPVPVAVEWPFKVRLPESHLVLRGRIDVVMSTSDKKGDSVEIRDYKTSTSATDETKAKSKASASNQLVMYALAWRLAHGQDPIQVTLDFVQTSQLGSVKKRSDSLDKMQAKLSEAAESIKAGKFPLGAKHDYCIHPLVGV